MRTSDRGALSDAHQRLVKIARVEESPPAQAVGAGGGSLRCAGSVTP